MKISDIVQWLALAVVGLVQWIFSRETRQMDKHRDDCDAHRATLDERLRGVEQQSATRAEIGQIRSEMQAGFGELRSELRAQVVIILENIQRGAR